MQNFGVRGQVQVAGTGCGPERAGGPTDHVAATDDHVETVQG